MKKALNAWSVPKQVSFASMFEQLSLAGFDGVELNLDQENASAHSLFMSTDDQVFAMIRSLSQQYSLPVCSISTSLYGPAQLGTDHQLNRKKVQAILLKQLSCAEKLGADTILVVPGGISENVSRLQAYELAHQILYELKDDIGSSGIKVGLENVWNSFFLSPTDMRDFIDSLGSASIGAYFDVGNVAVHSYPEDWIEILGRRIFKIHIKDFSRGGSWFSGHFVNLYEGDICWPKVLQALAKAGYDDWLTAELNPIEQNPALLYQMTVSAMNTMLEDTRSINGGGRT